MPVWCWMFQQTLDGPARGWFDRMPNGCIDGWADLREKFVKRFSLRRRCSKDPTEVSKIVRRANETLPDFKERWTEEMGVYPRGSGSSSDSDINDEASGRFCQVRKGVREHPTRELAHRA
ncbi:reverse transcriptase domain-containing protein [Tanacetum coccineum]